MNEPMFGQIVDIRLISSESWLRNTQSCWTGGHTKFSLIVGVKKDVHHQSWLSESISSVDISFKYCDSIGEKGVSALKFGSRRLALKIHVPYRFSTESTCNVCGVIR